MSCHRGSVWDSWSDDNTLRFRFPPGVVFFAHFVSGPWVIQPFKSTNYPVYSDSYRKRVHTGDQSSFWLVWMRDASSITSLQLLHTQEQEGEWIALCSYGKWLCSLNRCNYEKYISALLSANFFFFLPKMHTHTKKNMNCEQKTHCKRLQAIIFTTAYETIYFPLIFSIGIFFFKSLKPWTRPFRWRMVCFEVKNYLKICKNQL